MSRTLKVVAQVCPRELYCSGVGAITSVGSLLSLYQRVGAIWRSSTFCSPPFTAVNDDWWCSFFFPIVLIVLAGVDLSITIYDRTVLGSRWVLWKL